MIKSIFILFFMVLASCNSPVHKKLKPYSEILADIGSKRQDFNFQYQNALQKDKDSIILSARQYLTEMLISQIFPHWYGTPWDFNGMTRIPKKGTIACGYFVTNTLSDVGFEIPRIKWAQSAAETVIKELAFGKIKRFSNQPISTIKKYFFDSGEGLYLVGLDTHIGYVSVKEGEIRFIHADYYEPHIGVTSEQIDGHNPLKDSKYRVIGKLFENEMIINWINQTPFK